MLLKELNLIGFGKFKNQSIILKDGINLIYGENEAGKSTLHSFIDGMFYGFLKPNVKRRDYLPEYEKYNPWDNSRYAGIIRFRYNGKNYRIERIFTKGEEQTRVLDETTGVDITKNIDTGNGKILQPGIHFFGFNTRVFSNTIFIKQLGTKTDDKLANEVTEKLVNISTALDDNISVDKAVSELKIKMGEIGTDKAPTKPYARNLKDIESLEEEKRNILVEKDSYESYLEEKIRLNENLEIEIRNLSDLNGRLQSLEVLEKARVLEEAKILSGEIENIQNKLDLLSKENHEDIHDKKIEEVAKDYNYYEKIEEEKNRILYNKEDSKIEFLKRDYKDYEGKISNHKTTQMIIGLLAIIILGTAVAMENYLIVFALLPVIVLLRHSLNNLKKTNATMEHIKLEINNICNKEKEKQNRIEEINKIQKDILGNYNLDNKMGLKELLDKLQIENYRKKDKYEKYIKEIEWKSEVLTKVLGQNTIEGLTKELNNFYIDMNNKVQDMDKNQLRYQIERVKENISDFKIALKGVEENINILGKNMERLVVIEEELDRKKKYKEELENKYKSLEIAANVIEELSKDIHSQFAPSINKKVGKIVEKITGGKYNNVRISETLNIGVENPITREIVDINNLSGGTIDQLYFSLRFGIVNSMVDNRLPLILDDCFTQYDDNRLVNIINFLIDISAERQIILFTCHNREREILENLGVEFNLINLT